ncbi:HAD family hydrolase [Streptomyces sp. NPDC092296]|uniref:HAD family hydrolase n=1 Tax=Streptomyces sp. NPDC092296 TaxID=3366012 RepID=UPI003811774E
MGGNERSRLVLWDIDHTLLDGGGVSRDAYRSAFERVTGRPLEHMADMAGRTELLIAGDTLRLHGIAPAPDLLTRFINAVAAELDARADLLAARGRALPGASDALAALSRVPGVRQSVLTGNMRVLAELKLRAFGLTDHLDLAAGAYGDDAEERIALLPKALERAYAHYGHRFTGADTVIVGDTVLDVATAKAGGATILAVSTGVTSAEALRAAGAGTVLPSLSDTRAVVRAVLAADPDGDAAVAVAQ